MNSVPVTINTATRQYSAIHDTTLTRTAFVIGQLVSEGTGAPMPAPRLTAGALFARVASGGFFAVSGATPQAFPDLATTAYSIDLHFSAEYHKARTVTVNIPAGASFPINLGTIRLRPLPVRVEGRVTRESNRNPIAAAGITSTQAQIVILRTPAYMSHAPVNVTPVTMTNVGPLRTLTQMAPAGSLVLFVSNAAGLAGGNIVRVGTDPLSEFGVVQSSDTAASTVTLEHALRRTYPQTAIVRRVAAAPAGAAVAMTHDLDAGEAVLQLAAALGAGSIEISDAAPLIEYHHRNLIADGDGYFGADGIAGVPSLRLRASAAGFVQSDVEVPIDPGRAISEVSFRLKV